MKLFRRNPENPNCAWSVRFSVRNKIHAFSTKTTDKALAMIRAKDYRNKIVAGEYGLADGMKARSGCPTFAELFKAYNDLPEPSPLTRKRNIASMKAVLAASKLDETARLDKLGSGLAMAYKSKMKGDRPGSNSALISANTNLRRARSVFSKASMRAYKTTLSVPVEAVRSFMEEELFKAMKPEKQLPTAEAMAAAELALAAHPDHYRAYLMAKFAGARAGEILHARRSWFKDNVVTIGAFPNEFRPKSGKARSVAMPEEAVKIILSGDDPVFIAGPRRREIIAWELNDILKRAGVACDKPLHSLRRWFGSMIYSSQGAAAAKESLGHANVKTSEDHYLHLMTKQRPIAFAG